MVRSAVGPTTQISAKPNELAQMPYDRLNSLAMPCSTNPGVSMASMMSVIEGRSFGGVFFAFCAMAFFNSSNASPTF